MATQAFLLQRFNPQIPLQRPLSPALSNPDLILPDSEPSSEYPRYVERPPSPSQIIRKVQSQGRIASNNNRAIGGHLAKNYYGGTTKRLNWQVQEPQVLQIDAHVRAHEVRTPPLSRKSSNLEDIDELDATPTRADYDRHIPDEVLASSPTLKQITPLDRLTPDWNPPKLERKWSDASSSVHSDDFESLESLKWPGFDGPAGEDGDADEGSVMLDGEEEDSFGSFPEKRESDGDGDQEKFEGAKTGNENDPYSPDALSRRADVILANAKRRLNVRRYLFEYLRIPSQILTGR